MQLFNDTSFFFWAGALSLPAFLLGILEKPIRYYGGLVTLIFLWLAMGKNLPALGWLAGFTVGEYVLIRAYLHARRTKGRQTAVYRLVLFLSILPQILYKILRLWGNPHHIFAFLGLSYLTFKAAQMVIEIYDGLIEEAPAFDFFYLMLFFPDITSGPIDRSRRFSEDIHRRISRQEYLDMAGYGVFRFLQGMVYKQVVAALFYTVMSWFGMDRSLGSILLYMYAYGFYLFFDFAGYSSMAVGISYVFGVKTPENFRAPFVSKDMKEFWDRWHITLSHWFRDFIFTRVMMVLTRRRVGKDKLTRASLAFLINMGIMGLWHGLSPCYIIYGLYHGVLLSLTEVLQKKWKFYKKHKKDRWFIWTERIITFHLVMFGFLIFSNHLHELAQTPQKGDLLNGR